MIYFKICKTTYTVEDKKIDPRDIGNFTMVDLTNTTMLSAAVHVQKFHETAPHADTFRRVDSLRLCILNFLKDQGIAF